MTVVPLKLYFNAKGRAKVELALARGKKLHDKRETVKKRSWERERGTAAARQRLSEHPEPDLCRLRVAPATSAMGGGLSAIRPWPSCNVAGLVPVHGVPPRLQIVAAAVLVFQVIGVLPDVDADHRPRPTSMCGVS